MTTRSGTSIFPSEPVNERASILPTATKSTTHQPKRGSSTLAVIPLLAVFKGSASAGGGGAVVMD